MINHAIDHALTTIKCTLDGMAAVIEMTTEVEVVSTEAVGYLLLNCIATIREECNTIESVIISANKKETNTSADD